jgi:chromatin assembly factor 1 subunit B
VDNPYPFPYRILFAIATQNSVIFYDTQQSVPFAFISDIHYARISDVAWSKEGRLAIISSTDGFCTFVSFTAEELGDTYDGEPFAFSAFHYLTSASV